MNQSISGKKGGIISATKEDRKGKTVSKKSDGGDKKILWQQHHDGAGNPPPQKPLFQHTIAVQSPVKTFKTESPPTLVPHITYSPDDVQSELDYSVCFCSNNHDTVSNDDNGLLFSSLFGSLTLEECLLLLALLTGNRCSR
jgi:hypothetical protein